MATLVSQHSYTGDINLPASSKPFALPFDFVKGDGNSHQFNVTVQNNSEDVVLSAATCLFKIFRTADGGTVSIAADVDGSIMSKAFTAECTAYTMPIYIMAVVTSGSVERTVWYASARVRPGAGDVVVDPGSAVPSLGELLAAIADCEAATAAAEAATAAIASGLASPRGVYADLAALNTADPDHDYIYITLDDGYWCYYDTGTSAFVAGGIYLAVTAASALANLAPEYDPEAAGYALGKFVSLEADGKFYECTTLIEAPEAWTAGHWTERTIGYVLEALKAALDGKATSAQGAKADTALQPTIFNAHTIIAATADDTPAALTIGEQTVLGRETGGNIAALAINNALSSEPGSHNTLPSAKIVYQKLALKQTAATYLAATTSVTLALTDIDKFIWVYSGSAITITVPTYATVPFPVNTLITIARGGSGTATIAAAAGVTLLSAGGVLAIPTQRQVAWLRNIAADTWLVYYSLS
jgi:hypothetical protein